MMDIVERLRRYRPTYGWPEEKSVIVEPTMNHVAADEIDKLRKENQRQKEHIMLLYSMIQTEHEIMRVATRKEGE